MIRGTLGLGYAVYWWGDDGVNSGGGVCDGEVIAVGDGQAAVLRGNGTVQLVGCSRLHDLISEAEDDQPRAVWDASRCVEELAKWMGSHPQGTISGRIENDRWVIRLHDDRPNGRGVRGCGSDWCEAVQDTIQWWNRGRVEA